MKVPANVPNATNACLSENNVPLNCFLQIQHSGILYYNHSCRTTTTVHKSSLSNINNKSQKQPANSAKSHACTAFCVSWPWPLTPDTCFQDSWWNISVWTLVNLAAAVFEIYAEKNRQTDICTDRQTPLKTRLPMTTVGVGKYNTKIN